MDKRDIHLGKSYLERVRYGRILKGFTETEDTVSKKDFDSSDSSTSHLDVTVTPSKKRPRSFRKIVFSRRTFSIANILKGFVSMGGLAIVGFLLVNIIALNRDLGKVEERVKDIPVLSEKFDKIYEKLGDIDKSIYKVMIEIEKSNEINNIKFNELNKRVDSIKTKNNK